MVLALFYAIHVIISLFLIGVVLLQQGKGADLSVFGGGSTMTAFGARSATNILHKLTVIAFVSFMLTTLSIGVLQRGSDGTVMSNVPVAAPAAAPAAGDEQPAPATEDGDGAAAAASATTGDAEATGDDSTATEDAPPPATDDDAAVESENG